MYYNTDDNDCYNYDTDDNDCYDYDYGYESDDYESDDYDIEDEFSDFADPGGNSALRAATPSNPRIYPCPTCERPNRLTKKDVNLGYQCDACADRDERGGY